MLSSPSITTCILRKSLSNRRVAISSLASRGRSLLIFFFFFLFYYFAQTQTRWKQRKSPFVRISRKEKRGQLSAWPKLLWNQIEHLEACWWVRSSPSVRGRMDSLLRRNLLLVLLVAFLGIIHAAKKEGGPVSCGSVVKLKHKDTVRPPLDDSQRTMLNRLLSSRSNPPLL